MTDEDPQRTLYLAALAREMRDGDRVFLGANQNDAAMAAYAARRLWAPKLKLWANGMAQLDPAQDALRVGRGNYDNVLVAGRDATFWQARAFDDALRAPVVFAGGLQVDGRGDANLAGVPGQDGGWKLRGPGSAGLSSLTALADRFYLAVAHHTPLVLVERCAALSVLGDRAAREAAGMRPDALHALITPLARFEPTDDGLVLAEISPGVTVEDVAERTGFAVRPAEGLRERPAVTTEEASTFAALAASAAANAPRS